jgi:hypothetical protein
MGGERRARNVLGAHTHTHTHTFTHKHTHARTRALTLSPFPLFLAPSHLPTLSLSLSFSLSLTCQWSVPLVYTFIHKPFIHKHGLSPANGQSESARRAILNDYICRAVLNAERIVLVPDVTVVHPDVVTAKVETVRVERWLRGGGRGGGDRGWKE